eukprot:scaffold164473_cov26-Tisochrysis_lutea.AAC.1
MRPAGVMFFGSGVFRELLWRTPRRAPTGGNCLIFLALSWAASAGGSSDLCEVVPPLVDVPEVAGKSWPEVLELEPDVLDEASSIDVEALCRKSSRRTQRTTVFLSSREKNSICT